MTEIKSDSIILENSFTVFMVPFYFQNKNEDINSIHCALKGNPFWEFQEGKITNEGDGGDILYPYIMEFLQGDMDEKSLSSDKILRYCPKDNDKLPKEYKELWKALKDSYSLLGDTGKKFKVLKEAKSGFLTPHIFLSSSARIGILTYAIKIYNDQNTLSDLITSNYSLHKLHGQAVDWTCPSLKMNKFKGSEDVKQELIANKLNAMKLLKPNEKNIDVYSDLTWNMSDFVAMLLKCIGSKIRYFSNARAHLFTYCQIDDSVNENLHYDDLKPYLFQLSRIQNEKYQLDISNEDIQGSCLKTFSNIYTVSCVEGTVMMAVAKKVNKGFIENFGSHVRDRYLWLYMLAVIQRYSILNLNRIMAEDEDGMSSKELRSIYDVVQKVMIHNYYTDVSPYTHHNQFYNHSCKCLHVIDSYREIEKKTGVLSQNIIQNAQDEENEKQGYLNIIVSLLTVFQMGGVVFDFVNRDSSDNLLWPILVMVLSILIIIWLFRKNLVHFFQNRLSSKS